MRSSDRRHGWFNLYLTKALPFLALVALLLGAAPALRAEQHPASTESLMVQAERLFSQRDDLAKAEAAARIYDRILKRDPQNHKAAIRLVRLLVWVAAVRTDKNESAYYKRAAKLAEQAVKHHPRSPAAHFWLGVSQGLVADTSGFFTAMSLVDSVKQKMARVLTLQPAYAFGGAHRVLGRLYSKLPWLLGGSRSKAEKHLRRAVALGPGHLLNYLYLADVLMKQDRTEEAVALLIKVSRAQPQPGWEAESRVWSREAARILVNRMGFDPATVQARRP